MKFLILILIILNTGFVFALETENIDWQEGGQLFKDGVREGAQEFWVKFKEYFTVIFSWIGNHLKDFWLNNIWPKISAPLSKEIDTRKNQIEEKIEDVTDNVKESLLQRFKRIIRYD
ncbi:MAG: hypothetical protein PHN37_01540 [Candidatus Pacebacteria bacterium]|nr:hypothetical protein [Candidatus Paceibacterota bacterium]